MGKKVFLNEFSALEVKQLLEHRQDVVAIVPFGSCESHGWHCPLGPDYFVPTEVARRVAAVSYTHLILKKQARTRPDKQNACKTGKKAKPQKFQIQQRTRIHLRDFQEQHDGQRHSIGKLICRKDKALPQQLCAPQPPSQHDDQKHRERCIQAVNKMIQHCIPLLFYEIISIIPQNAWPGR